MSSFLRDSKFRNTTVTVRNREEHYEQLRVASISSDGNLLTCNANFLAYIDSAAGGAACAVLPLSSVGKNHIPVLAPSYQQPLIRAHSQPIQDIAFNPFNPQQIYTCSTDCTVKAWEVPKGGYIVDDNTPVITLATAENTPFRGLAPHPTADNLLAARGTRDIFLFDLASGSASQATSLSTGSDGDLQSMSWSFLGDVLCATGKDKNLRICDLRTGGVNSTTSIHGGNRNSRTIWLGSSPYILTCGHSATQEREWAIWDSRSLESGSPVKRQRIDSSTGCLMPFFDPDTNLLALVGKGDSTLRLYEFDSSASGDVLFPISNTPIGDVTKGAALLPKQANDLMSCEVMRVLKLTENSIQPISLAVPRKEKKKYHDDLYPDSYWGAPPTSTSADWLSGSSDIRVNTVPIAAPAGANYSTISTTEESVAVETGVEGASGGAVEASSTIGNRLSMTLGSQSKFKHMYGTEIPKSGTFYNIKPSTSSMDSPLIACSDTYWATPYQGGGGPVYVSRLDNFGKVEPSCPVVNGHKAPVLDISFSPFHSDLFATASDDCTVKLWRVPEGGVRVDMSETDAIQNLTTHRHAVRTANFHPTVMGLLCTTSLDLTLRLYDVNTGSQVLSCEPGLTEGGTVANVSFSYDGSFASLACKDRIVRILDLRTGEVGLSTPSGALGRNMRAEWCSSSAGLGSIVTVFSATSGMRTIQLWDPRSLAAPTCTASIDNAAGQLFPMYDEGLGLCFVAGKGDTIIRYYEMTFLESGLNTCIKSNEFQSSRSPISGICLLPKKLCDVRNVEVARVLKMTTDSVLPISFTVPRADHLKAYFQDDIYPPTRSRTSWTASADQWATARENGESLDTSPVLESLQPEGMIASSEKPVEAPKASKVASFRSEINKAEEEKKERDSSFTRLQGLAIQRSLYHPNASGGAGGHGFKVDAAPVTDNEVDDADWDD